MDKGILKKFAIGSRKDLMEKIKNKINTFYIDEEFKKEQKGEIYVLSNEKHSLSLTNEEYQKRYAIEISDIDLESLIREWELLAECAGAKGIVLLGYGSNDLSCHRGTLRAILNSSGVLINKAEEIIV